MIDLLEQPESFRQWCRDQGLPAYRHQQVFHWLFHHRAADFSEMTDLPKSLRQRLATHFRIGSGSVERHLQSADGTEKLLIRLVDGGAIESVLLRDGQRRTICVSSQVGCAMGCVFCASGLDGVERNLSAGEIIQQMWRLARLLPAHERLSHIVMMGMGEPLANLDHVLAALDWASRPDGLGISPRRITISTVGIPQAIDRLAERDSRFHLAVSLHAPNDELRNRLVPINRRIGLENLLDAARRYFEVSGRRLTYEYVLLAGINDRPEHARELADRLRGHNALLNVIPYNPVSGLEYATPTARTIQQFQSILESKGIRIKFRQRKGDDIEAACGQLRRNRASG